MSEYRILKFLFYRYNEQPFIYSQNLVHSVYHFFSCTCDNLLQSNKKAIVGLKIKLYTHLSYTQGRLYPFGCPRRD